MPSNLVILHFFPSFRDHISLSICVMKCVTAIMESQDHCVSDSCEKLVFACFTCQTRDLEHRPFYKSSQITSLNLVLLLKHVPVGKHSYILARVLWSFWTVAWVVGSAYTFQGNMGDC